MKRNVSKTIDEAQKIINSHYDLDINIMHQIAELSDSKLNLDNYYLISNAFLYGYIMGIRSARKEGK